MEKIFMLAKNNMKKRRLDMALFIFLTALAGMMIFSSITILTGVYDILEDAYKKHNTADFMAITTSGTYDKKAEDIIRKTDGIKEFETEEMLMWENYYEGENVKKRSYTFFFSSIEDERSINHIDGTDLKSTDDILLPYYMAGDFAVGNDITFYFNDEKLSFNVAGFVDDPIFASPINISIYSCYTSQERYDYIKNVHEAEITKRCTYSAKLDEGIDRVEFEQEMSEKLAEKCPELFDYSVFIVNWDSMRGGASYMTYISVGMILAFSLLIFIVALVIMSFRIRSFIEENMKSMGILEAAGYTPVMLRAAVVLENALLAMAAAAVGIVTGILFMDRIGKLESTILGLPWNVSIDAVEIVGVILSLGCFAGIISMLFSRRIMKLSVLELLRGGIETHNFKRVPFPIDKSRLPLPLVLSLKEIFSAPVRSTMLVIVVAVLSTALCMGFGLYSKFVNNIDTILDFAGIEAPTAWCDGMDEEMKADVSKWDEVKQIILIVNTNPTIEYGDNSVTISCAAMDEPGLLEHESILSGRLPKSDDEIVIAYNASEALGVKVGDMVYIRDADNKKIGFVVCGIDQKMQNLGRTGIATISGIERISGKVEGSSIIGNIYANDGYSFSDMEKHFKREYEGRVLLDAKAQMKETVNTVSNAVSIVCIIFVIITNFIIVFVETLLIRSKVLKSKRQLGLYKGLGFSNSYLMLWTMLSNLPIFVTGAIIGVLASGFVGKEMLMLTMGAVGLRDVELHIAGQWMLLSVFLIVAMAVLSSFLSGLSIRRLEPVKLLTEE